MLAAAAAAGAAAGAAAAAAAGARRLLLARCCSQCAVSDAQFPSGIADKELLEGRIRGQYAAVAGGAAIAFVAGGQLYERLGFAALCWFGLACAAAHLCLALFYRAQCLYQPKRVGSQAAADSTSPLGSCYQIIALSYLIEEANSMTRQRSVQMTEGRLPLDVLTSLAVRAKDDEVLHNSLRELHQAAASDNVTREGPTQARRRLSVHNSTVEDTPDLIAKIYQCSVQLMDTDNNGEVSLKEFVAYLGPRVYYRIHGDTSNEVDVIWPYMQFVVATQAIVAFCIGSFLSTALLMVRALPPSSLRRRQSPCGARNNCPGPNVAVSC